MLALRGDRRPGRSPTASSTRWRPGWSALAHVLALTTWRAAGELRGGCARSAAARRGCARPRSTRPRCAAQATSGPCMACWRPPRVELQLLLCDGGCRSRAAHGRRRARRGRDGDSSGRRSARTSTLDRTCSPRRIAGQPSSGVEDTAGFEKYLRGLRRTSALIDFESAFSSTAAILLHRACRSPAGTHRWSVLHRGYSRTSTRCRSCCSTPGSAAGRSCAWSATRAAGRFTGSPGPKIEYLVSFTEDYPRGELMVRLFRDYLSTPQVVRGELLQATPPTWKG